MFRNGGVEVFCVEGTNNKHQIHLLIRISVVTQTNSAICHIAKCTVQYVSAQQNHLHSSSGALGHSICLSTTIRLLWINARMASPSRKRSRECDGYLRATVRGRTIVTQNCFKPRGQWHSHLLRTSVTMQFICLTSSKLGQLAIYLSMLELER